VREGATRRGSIRPAPRRVGWPRRGRNAHRGAGRGMVLGPRHVLSKSKVEPPL
ncbi:MAG: hypothetical protein AVDCRST_MAG73-1103, partial [uncultured Thermomicrobiales bacterium]